MKKELHEQLKKALLKKLGVEKLHCPMCQREMLVLDGIFLTEIYIDSLKKSSKYIVPTIPVVCTHCGHLSQHCIHLLVEDVENFRRNYEANENEYPEPTK